MNQLKQRSLLRVLGPVLMIVCLLSLIALSPAGGGQTGVNPKIASFLKVVEMAASLEQVRTAYKTANFSSDEQKLLQAEINKPLYASKLKALGDKALPAPKDPALEIQSMKLAYEQQRMQQLQAYNLQVQAKLQAVSSRVVATVLPAKTSPQLATALSQARTIANIPVVSSITPQSALVGQVVDVSGEKFGSAQGSAYIEIASQQFPCSDIRSWSDTHVRLAVPADVQSLVRDDDKSAKLYIAPPSGGAASGNMIVRPDPTTVTPAITSINTTAITPGQLVYIEGRNFLNNQGQGIEWIQAGGVNFMIGNKSYTGTVTIWGDTYIGVTMPAMTGLTQQQGLVQVKNKRLLVSTPVSFTFVPTLEKKTFIIHESIGNYLSVFGDDETDEHNHFLLINNWKVVESYMTKGSFGSGDCYYQRKPSPGSTNALSIVRLWTDAFSEAWCTDYLIIEGPAGVPYKQ